jgi:hypothetical protein
MLSLSLHLCAFGKALKKILFSCFLLMFVCTFVFKEHNRMNKHDVHHRTVKLTSRHHHHHHHRRSYQEQNSASSISFDNNRSNDVVSPTNKREISRNSFHPRSDSDGETETTVVRPWAPVSNHPNGTSVTDPYNNNNNDNNNDNNNPNSPSLTVALRLLFEMITEDLDKFVFTPAPNGLGDVQCRITRDKRGMEKGLFPTYYMHVERPGDGKKVDDLN